MDVFKNAEASWIWIEADQKEVNEYVEFRHEFIIEDVADADAELYISADSDYEVWLNGDFIDCGQWDDYPDSKAYDILKVGGQLKAGKNVLCILVYYQGETSFQYIQGEPGLIYVLQSEAINITSGRQTLCRKSSSYTNGPIEKITSQLGFTFEYDARADDGWVSSEYILENTVNNAWKESQIHECIGKVQRVNFYERPVKKLVIGESTSASIVAQGIFIRIPEDGKTIAQLMQSDFLSTRSQRDIFSGESKSVLPSTEGLRLKPSCSRADGGVYILIDLHKEEVGFFELDIQAPAGTIIDFSYGEHLDDLRVRASVGDRNFACRYICRSGRQRFIHYFKRIAGRYIQLHISCPSEEIILFYAGVKPCEYPVELRGSFNSCDHLYNKIYEISVRTLQLCMHEHYEDCPWREQALYSMDSRNQALCGYYCFGEYDFPQASFSLLGDGLGQDGYLEICAPTEYYMTIPSFSMAWIMELADHYLFSGRIEPVRAAMPKVKRMISAYLENLEDGLLKTPEGQRYWNFYEWTDGLDGLDRSTADEEFSSSSVRQSEKNRFDAPLNLFLCMALESAAMLANACKDSAAAQEYILRAESIKKAFHRKFWDENREVYRTYSGDVCQEHYAELTQALAICAKACDEKIAEVLRECLAKEQNGLVKTTLSYSLYKYQALLECPEKYAAIVFDEITKHWGHMLFNKATSFWETIKGADDFDGAGSLCHGWSAIPVYFYCAYILGVKPLEPGFRTFKVEPVSSVLYRASGKIPTPYGDICVEWEKIGGEIKCNVSSPEGTVRV